MINDQTQFVIVPQFLYIDKHGLEYKDILVYTAIRSFENNETGQCNPTYTTVNKRAGVARNYVIKSIKRLERCGVVKVYRKQKGKTFHNYCFENPKISERIPFELFTCDLSPCCKALLIAIRQFFCHGILTTLDTVSKMAEKLGITYAAFKKQYDSLLLQGYIAETKGKSKKSLSIKLTDKIDWLSVNPPKAPKVFPKLTVG